MTEMKSPISEEQLLAAEVGQKIIDAKGYDWKILSKAEKHNGNVTVTVSYNCGPSEILVLTEGQFIEQEEWAIIMELNHPSVKLV